MDELKQFKNKKIENVIDSIKAIYPVVRICYPRAVLTNDHRPERLNIYVDVHGFVTSFDIG